MTCESGYERGRRRLELLRKRKSKSRQPAAPFILAFTSPGIKSSLVIFLTGGIPKGQLDPLSIHIDIGNIVLKDGRNVDLSSIPMRRGRNQPDWSRLTGPKTRYDGRLTSGNIPLEKTIKRQVFPHAPSPIYINDEREIMQKDDQTCLKLKRCIVDDEAHSVL